MLDITQAELASAAGMSRSFVAEVETGRTNPSFDAAMRIGEALGLDLQIIGRTPVVVGSRTRDAVHARCSGYADRRLSAAGWSTRREVAVTDGSARGWIDLLAYHPVTRTLLIIEIKTRLDDIGAIERQLSWYERISSDVARAAGWPFDRRLGCLILLASDEVDRAIRANGEVLRTAFPIRAAGLRSLIEAPERAIAAGRGLALIDPRSRRRDWLLASRTDGRRTAAPYSDYAHAARRFEQ